jgi:hypothetical protein
MRPVRYRWTKHARYPCRAAIRRRSASSDIARRATWFLAMTEQITTMTPKMVDEAVDLPGCASLGALIDWRAVKQLAASLLGGHRLAVV